MPTLTRDVVRVVPVAGAHRVALRAGFCLGVPLLALWAAGHLDLALYATFGAFTALYGRQVVGPHRLSMQGAAGMLLVACVAAGTLTALSDARSWIAPLGAAVVATGASLASDRGGWHPPGALFPVFAYAGSAAVPATLERVPLAVGMAAATAVLALAVGALGHASRRWPAVVVELRPATEAVRVHALRNGLGVLVAGVVATGLGIGHPYWAMVGAAAPLGFRSPRGVAVRGVQRLVGTLAGVVVAALLLRLDPPGLAVVALVVALQVGAELLVGRNYALALLCVTPLALLMVHLASPEPARELLVDRGVETLVGVVVGVLVGLLVRPRIASPGARPR